MKLSNTRAVISMLALPTYIWVKAMVLRYFHHAFDPASDIYFPVVFAAFGLVPKKDDAPPGPA